MGSKAASDGAVEQIAKGQKDVLKGCATLSKAQHRGLAAKV